ncbi:MAG: DUF2934 domain-containing protein [Thermodesulfovibrionales bacterium]
MNLQEEIAKVAYELYLRRGCVHGHDLDDWLEAERIVLARHSGQEIEEPEVEVSEEEEVISETMPTTEAEETVIEETETPIVEEPKKKGGRRKTTKKAEEKPKRAKKTTGKRPRKKE